MKTFDEAFEIIYKQFEERQHVFIENYTAGSVYKDNKNWLAMIGNICNQELPHICALAIQGMHNAENVTKEMAEEIGIEAPEGVRMMAMPMDVMSVLGNKICTMLHISFQMGVLTGIEMEKPE